MVWGFTLKGEAIFENAFTLYVTLYVALYVKFAFNYYSQRKPAEKREEGANRRPDFWKGPGRGASVGDESHLETVSET